MAQQSGVGAQAQAKHQKQLHAFMTSGATDAVWVHKDPYSKRPQFGPLDTDTRAEVCVVGSGITGASVAYELVARGHEVVMLEARGVLGGETGRTSGHLSNALDDGYVEIQKKHGRAGAKAAADSHTWAIARVGEVAANLGIECEYRRVPAYEVSQFARSDEKNHAKDVASLREEADLARELGVDAHFKDDLAVKGWDGKVDQRGVIVFGGQGAFHPTIYVGGLLGWLKNQPNFRCFTGKRVMSITEGSSSQGAFGVYQYVRFTACDDADDYMIVGGCDHEVGQEDPSGRFEELETWVRERFLSAGAVDYRWSGHIVEPVDYMAFIGRDQGRQRTYMGMTGDSGNGLTHGVLAGRLIADLVEGKENPWQSLYSPSRVASIAKSASHVIMDNVHDNMQYKRLLQSDITDIEDLAAGSGGVMTEGLGTKVAVYKGEDGSIKRMSAICPHLGGVICWNKTEKSWDCPVHGSRFDANGTCLNGPAKGNLKSLD
ncbi:FAD dependent oxidoreductase [Magnaporthiopsis poae ATCC 64411]|uniref:FAD dependent oxidoreductase n=1 Tax=Magnaporthiopsis poae (strain ATCC 64411 / 73-15) TaxID=644358 RepID=A0A0C4EFM1_MAGP6|nr:FAD dependent oxidoreductase [Magnaporthiopsis poae ATCC 64411]